MIKKICFILLMLAMAVSAYAGTREITKNYELPEGMEDCRVFKLVDGIFDPVLFITRCPLSKTSTSNTRHKNTDVSSILDYTDNDVPDRKENIIQMNGKRYMEIK